MALIDALKDDMEFGDMPKCGNCEHCEKDNYHADRPTVFRCGYAGKIVFEVDENDGCQKWEAL